MTALWLALVVALTVGALLLDYRLHGGLNQ